MNRSATILKLLLRLTAAAMIVAVVPAFMPIEWMDRLHRFAGPGPLPQGPAVDYMARTLSAMYAMFGGLLWLMAGDLRRYRAALVYLAIVGAAFSVFVTVVDALLGLPWWWTWGEGPATLAVCLAILVLLPRAVRQAAQDRRDAAQCAPAKTPARDP